MVKKTLVLIALVTATVYSHSLYSSLCECTLSTQPITDTTTSSTGVRTFHFQYTNISNVDDCRTRCQEKKAEYNMPYMTGHFTK